MGLIESYFTNGVDRIYQSSKDKWGEPTEATEEDVHCRIVWGSRRVTTPAGDQVISSAKVLFDPSQTIDYEDKIVIDNVRHTILSIREPKDFMVQFKEVYIA